MKNQLNEHSPTCIIRFSTLPNKRDPWLLRAVSFWDSQYEDGLLLPTLIKLMFKAWALKRKPAPYIVEPRIGGQRPARFWNQHETPRSFSKCQTKLKHWCVIRTLTENREGTLRWTSKVVKILFRFMDRFHTIQFGNQSETIKSRCLKQES